MKKLYESPEFEIVNIKLNDQILSISQDETGESGGFIDDPEDDII